MIKMKLLDWISLERLDWQELSANPSDGAVDLLLANPYNIYFSESAENTNDRMVKRLLNFNDPERIDRWRFAENPNHLAVEYTLSNVVDDFYFLCENPNDRMVDFIFANIDKIDLECKINLECFSMNSNDRAVDYLLKFPELINWDWLSMNSNDRAVKLLLENPDKINYDLFSRNPNDRALDHLLANEKFIDWDLFSLNPNKRVIEVLKQNQEHIHWQSLSRNPNIFEYDYLPAAKERTSILLQELMEKTWHPSRMQKWCLEYNFEF